MIWFFIIILSVYPCWISGNINNILEPDNENQKIDLLVDLIRFNLKSNGWNNIFCFGHLPNSFYDKIQFVASTFNSMNLDDEDQYIDDVVPYHSNVIVINCLDFDEFERMIPRATVSPYWHPLANIIMYYHKSETKDMIAKIFFIMWYYKASNFVLVQYDDDNKEMLISNYSPFVSDKFKMDNNFGCWTARKLGLTIPNFTQGFVCVESCHNITSNYKLRMFNLGACMGYNTNKISYGDRDEIKKLNIFEDKGENFHGYSLRAYVTEILPFMIVTIHDNNTITLSSRDGQLWNTLSELMNFTIDFSPSLDTIKNTFNFELNIQQIFSYARRKGDLFLLPIYQFDVIVVEVDYTFAYKDSGVCFASHRAGFETVLFDIKTLQNNYKFVIQFGISFVCIWIVFSVYDAVEKGKFTFDQAGKDFMNTVRTVLLITLYNPPKISSFRIFLGIIIWCFFLISFLSQASIISFFTAFQRGKEVETFEDIIEKGYNIEGMASPDVVLPDSEERFEKINSKLVPIQNVFECVDNLANDSHRFCLVDCSVARYLKRNKLNDKGEQYIHVAKDRIHSNYLNIILPKHSIMYDQFNKYMMVFFEAGLIMKWEQYRYDDIKEEAPIKPLGMNDLKGIFNGYCLLMALTFVIFLFELFVGNLYLVKKKCSPKVTFWKRT